MDYLDFEIEIEVGSGRRYPLAVVRSPAGEARETMLFPFDELTLENRLKDLQIALLRSGGTHRQLLSPEEQAVQTFGRALFDALFTGEVRSRYAVSQREAAQQGKGLRLKLRIHPPELAALPWEFLYDGNEAEYVCLSSNTPIVRYLELPRPPQPLVVTPPLRILGMTVSPKDLVRLDIENEKQRVVKATADLRANGLVELTWLPRQTWQDLQRAMRHGPWHIFHFIGHGGFDSNTDEGLIAIEEEEGKAHFLRATNLGRLLTDHRFLRLVVLNSCEGAKGSEHDIFSSTAAILVRRGIPAVLAMQYEITDRTAIALSRAFYEALADGEPVDTAVSEARKAISIRNTVEWGTPVLYMRSPDGVLFNLLQKPPAQQEWTDQPAIKKAASETSPTLSQEHRKMNMELDPSLPVSVKSVEQVSQAQDETVVEASPPMTPSISEPSRTFTSASFLSPSEKSQRRLSRRTVVVGLAGVAVAGGGITWLLLTIGGSGNLVTITGAITSVDAANHSLTLNVNGHSITVKGLTDQDVATLQGQVGKTSTLQATQNSDGTYTIAAGAKPTVENETPTATQAPATTATPVAFKAGGISFIGPVKSITTSSLVMSAPNGQSYTLAITAQTDRSAYGGSLPAVGSSVNMDSTINPDGSLTATRLQPAQPGNPDLNVIAYTGITTSAVGADRLLHFTVGVKSYTYTIPATAYLSDFSGNAQAIGTNVSVKVKVLYPTNTVVSVENG